MMYANEPRQARIWIRGVYRFDSGKTITRTVRREFVVHPGDDERVEIKYDDLLAEAQSAGWDFPEGHGTLVAFLGVMDDGTMHS
jgi:hypothetical protein